MYGIAIDVLWNYVRRKRAEQRNKSKTNDMEKRRRTTATASCRERSTSQSCRRQEYHEHSIDAPMLMLLLLLLFVVVVCCRFLFTSNDNFETERCVAGALVAARVCGFVSYFGFLSPCCGVSFSSSPLCWTHFNSFLSVFEWSRGLDHHYHHFSFVYYLLVPFASLCVSSVKLHVGCLLLQCVQFYMHYMRWIALDSQLFGRRAIKRSAGSYSPAQFICTHAQEQQQKKQQLQQKFASLVLHGKHAKKNQQHHTHAEIVLT